MKTFKKTTNCLLLSALGLFLNGCFHSDDNGSDTNSRYYPLNDTGVNTYVDETDNGDNTYTYTLSTSPATPLPGQDASHGRDLTLPEYVDGELGFSFSKLDEAGTVLEDQTGSYTDAPWSCIRDNQTGLFWEVKTLDGLQRNSHGYTWYNPDDFENGGHSGSVGNSNSCLSTLSSCNTSEYLQEINKLNNTGLCGFNDWRLPTREELRSLVHYGKPTGSAMIDTAYFPNTAATDHWTSQTAIYASEDGSMAWELHFDSGHSEAHNKDSQQIAIRLVRGP